MPDVTIRRMAEMDAGFAGHFIRARASLGVSAFGLSVLELGPGFDGYPEHAHDVDGQEEVLVVLDGSATLHAGDEVFELDRDTMARVGPSCRRRVVPGPDGVRLLVVGGRAGHPYAAPDFSVIGAPDSARRAGPPV